jgi:predicted nucleotide-binding protein (sugar kinase/HSP70/actin superfamily)
MCEIHTLTVKGERPLHYGGRCERHEIETKKKDMPPIPDLFAERETLLQQFEKENEKIPASAHVISIPGFYFYDLLPFWATYFNALGFRVELSDQTTNNHSRRTGGNRH